METFQVGVEKDHIERLAKAKPINAISELIWNSYDAGASEVRVEFEEGKLVELGLIRVTDNGTGISYDTAQEFFANLGGSWKQETRRTDKGRPIHGFKGQGRLKAFTLGSTVEWQSSCDGQRFTISGALSDLKTFRISDPVKSAQRQCAVEITDISKDFEIRDEHGFADRVRDVFALQLYEDPGFSIIYDGKKIDASEAIQRITPVSVTGSVDDGTVYSATLDIVEWRRQVDRNLLLCLPGRFSFHEMAPGVQARGFSFTAYLTADHFQTLADENREGLVELDAPSLALINAAKDALRAHFREREAQRAHSGACGQPFQ